MKKSRILGAAMALSLTVALSACGSPAGEGGSAEGSAEGPVTIKHAYGETVIEETPTRAASIGWGNSEVALALGVVPVGMAKATWGDDDGDGVLPWVEDKLKEMDAETPTMYDETDGVDFEAVADTKPDVILASYSGITQEEYDTLSKIAPTIAFPETAWATTWQDMTTINGTALGKKAEAEKLVAEKEDKIASLAAEKSNLKGSTAMFATFSPDDLSTINFYTDHDTRAQFLKELGMNVPTVVQEETEKTDAFTASRSAEDADAFSDVNVILGYNEESQLADLQGDALLKQLPAIKNGAFAALGGDGPVAAAANPSPLNIDSPQFEEYLTILDDAAAKSK